MKFKGKLIALTLLIATLLFVYRFQPTVKAQPRTPGVTVGEWFRYKVEAYLNSTDENATFPEDLILLGESILTEVSVLKVSDSNITYTMTYHFENGSQVSKQYWVDVDSGNGTLTMTFIGANLTEGDQIYASPEYVNKTIDSQYYYVYAGGFREVVGMHYTEPITDGLHGHETIIFIWDRMKGATLEFSYQLYMTNATYTYNATISTQIIETNVWKKKMVGTWHGDWIRYVNVNFTLISTFKLVYVPEFLTLYNQTEWVINRVLYVNDTLITFEHELHLENGTEKTYILQVNVASGEGNMTAPGLITPIWFIAANLEVGDNIFDNPWSLPVPINRTETFRLFNIQRRINIANISITVDMGSGNLSITGFMKWDKFTGVLIEAEGYMHFENQTDYVDMWCSAKINATNLWGETTHTVEIEGSPFEVTVLSNTSVYEMSVNTSEKALIFNVRGLSGVGFCNVSIPTSLMWGSTWEVCIDGQPIEDVTVTPGDNYTYIYFEYTLSEHEVKIVSENIVPEFSLTTLIIMLINLLTVAIAKKHSIINKNK